MSRQPQNQVLQLQQGRAAPRRPALDRPAAPHHRLHLLHRRRAAHSDRVCALVVSLEVGQLVGQAAGGVAGRPHPERGRKAAAGASSGGRRAAAVTPRPQAAALARSQVADLHFSDWARAGANERSRIAAVRRRPGCTPRRPILARASAREHSQGAGQGRGEAVRARSMHDRGASSDGGLHAATARFATWPARRPPASARSLPPSKARLQGRYMQGGV